MPGNIEEDSAQLDLWGGPGPQTNPIPLEEDRGRLPSGHHPDEPFDQVGSVWESDLPHDVAAAAKKILPRDRDRRQCVEELESTAANRGLTYRQVLEAYAECVSGLAESAESSPQASPKGGLVPPEALIERMRQALDALERHYPLDCRIEHAPGDDVTITNPLDVAEYFRPAIAHLTQEQLRVLWLDTRNQVIGQHMAHQGDNKSSMVRAADVFRQPMAAGASSVILAHNHPSGNSGPSPEDIKITKELKQVADQLGIELLDHVVIGRSGHGDYTSLNERDLLQTRKVKERRADIRAPSGASPPGDSDGPPGIHENVTREREQAGAPAKRLEKPDSSRGSVKPLCSAAEENSRQGQETGPGPYISKPGSYAGQAHPQGPGSRKVRAARSSNGRSPVGAAGAAQARGPVVPAIAVNRGMINEARLVLSSPFRSSGPGPVYGPPQPPLDELHGTTMTPEMVGDMDSNTFGDDDYTVDQRVKAARWLMAAYELNRRRPVYPRIWYPPGLYLLGGKMGGGKTLIGTNLAVIFAICGWPTYSSAAFLFGKRFDEAQVFAFPNFVAPGCFLFLDELHAIYGRYQGSATRNQTMAQATASFRKQRITCFGTTAREWLVGGDLKASVLGLGYPYQPDPPDPAPRHPGRTGQSGGITPNRGVARSCGRASARGSKWSASAAPNTPIPTT